jgi:hypothetical protein
MSLDDSVHSQYALSWAASHLLRAGDTVTCLTVALPVPYPVSGCAAPGASADGMACPVFRLSGLKWRLYCVVIVGYRVV